MRLMRELRKNKKKKGMLALEAAMALLMVVMASYGVAATSAMEFSQMAASRTAKQAEQYAELEADYLRMVGFYHFDDGSTVYNEPHGRQNMTKIVGDEYGSEWESKVTHVNDITVDKFTSVKVARIDVYKTGDGDVPRFTLEVPLTSSSGDVPIGGIITWPSDTLPDWFNKDQYLECNGQSFNTSEYPHLAELYPDGRVPNYSGLFLRGSGSQDYSQLNGLAMTFSDYDKWDGYGKWTNNQPTTTKYSSGNVGEIQGDAVRDYVTDSTTEFLQFKNNTSTPRLVPGYPWNGVVTWAIAENEDGAARAQGHYVHNYDPPWGDALHLKNIFFTHHPKHYKYRLVSSGGGDDGETSYSLEEYTEPADDDEGFWTNAYAEDIAFQLAAALPVANEIRPVNVAVKYFIRAR